MRKKPREDPSAFAGIVIIHDPGLHAEPRVQLRHHLEYP